MGYRNGDIPETDAELYRAIDEKHSSSCPRKGFRHGTTRRDGRVVMLCKGPRCSARRIV